MSNITISKAASERIRVEKNGRLQALRQSLIPRLIYYYRMHAKLNDGSTMEHGSGIFLDFIEPEEMSDDKYLSVNVEGEMVVALAPLSFFQTGVHFIDWVDRRFTLAASRSQDTLPS